MDNQQRQNLISALGRTGLDPNQQRDLLDRLNLLTDQQLDQLIPGLIQNSPDQTAEVLRNLAELEGGFDGAILRILGIHDESSKELPRPDRIQAKLELHVHVRNNRRWWLHLGPRIEMVVEVEALDHNDDPFPDQEVQISATYFYPPHLVITDQHGHAEAEFRSNSSTLTQTTVTGRLVGTGVRERQEVHLPARRHLAPLFLWAFVLLLGWMFWPPEPEAEVRPIPPPLAPPTAPAQVPPTTPPAPVTIPVINGTKEPIFLFWRDEKGQDRLWSIGGIPPSRTWNQTSYPIPGSWVVKDAKGNVLRTFPATEQTQIVVKKP